MVGPSAPPGFRSAVLFYQPFGDIIVPKLSITTSGNFPWHQSLRTRSQNILCPGGVWCSNGRRVKLLNSIPSPRRHQILWHWGLKKKNLTHTNNIRKWSCSFFIIIYSIYKSFQSQKWSYKNNLKHPARFISLTIIQKENCSISNTYGPTTFCPHMAQCLKPNPNTIWLLGFSSYKQRELRRHCTVLSIMQLNAQKSGLHSSWSKNKTKTLLLRR